MNLTLRKNRGGQTTARVVAQLLILLVVAFSVSVRATQADVQALLQFQSELNGFKFPFWDISNAPNVCSNWACVLCDSNGRVSQLLISGDQFSAPINGTVSPALANLTELTRVVFFKIDLYGDFPEQFWALPQLAEVTLRGPKVKVRFPAQVSQKLTYLQVDGVKVDGPIPDIFNWTILNSMLLDNSELYCPLPAGLISWLTTGNKLCSFAFTTLEVVDNKVCGQISVHDFNCPLFPLVVPFRATENDKLLYTATRKSLQLEFSPFDLKIYGIMANGAIYRTEYIQVNFQPLQPEHAAPHTAFNGSKADILDRFTLSPLESFTWVTPNALYVNSTMHAKSGASIAVSWIYEFDREDSNLAINGNKFKFSIRVFNNNYDWGKAEGGSVNFVTIYRSQHSPEDGPPLYCGRFEYVQLACSSSVANVTLHTEMYQGYLAAVTNIVMNTASTIMSFSYGLIGTIDGEPMTKYNTGIDGTRFLPGIGHISYLDIFQQNNRADLLPKPGPAAKQSWNLAFSVELPRFQEIFYDPDIQMQLLFDFGSAPSDTTAIAAGVGVTAAVVVAAAAVGLVFYIRQRNSETRQMLKFRDKLNAAAAPDSAAAPIMNPWPKKAGKGGWTSATIDSLETRNTA